MTWQRMGLFSMEHGKAAYRADFAAMDPGYKNGLNPLDNAGAAAGRGPGR